VRDHGLQMRLSILRQDAENGLLAALHAHGREAQIEREDEEGDGQLVIAATRQDVTRRAALLYCPARREGRSSWRPSSRAGAIRVAHCHYWWASVVSACSRNEIVCVYRPAQLVPEMVVGKILQRERMTDR